MPEVLQFGPDSDTPSGTRVWGSCPTVVSEVVERSPLIAFDDSEFVDAPPDLHCSPGGLAERPEPATPRHDQRAGVSIANAGRWGVSQLPSPVGMYGTKPSETVRWRSARMDGWVTILQPT